MKFVPVADAYRRSSRLLLLSFFVLVICGCSPEHTDADLKKCIAQSTRNYPADPRMSAEEQHDAIGADVLQCMRDIGYRQDTSGEKCLDDLEFNVACYVPRRH